MAGHNHLYSVDLSIYIIAPRLSAPVINEVPFVGSKISAFPNPANSFVFIQNDETFSRVEVVISNLTGQITNRMIIDNPEQKIRIETELLKPGIYTVHLIGDDSKEKSVLLSVIH